jgi:hypothetical protein
MRKHLPATCALVLVVMGLWTVFGRAGMGSFAAATSAKKPACHATR